MVWKCQNPACGAENEDSEDYCTQCGLQKGSGAPSAPSSQPEMQPVQEAEAQLEEQPAAIVQAPEAKLELVKSSIALADEFLVTNGKSLGRAVENDIILPDTYVSRKHAKIDFQNGAYVVEDLGSTNGTFLNGDDIQGKGKQALKNGDEIRLGTTVFRFKQA